MSHLLLRYSHRFTPTADTDVPGWNYCRKIGIWLSDENIDTTSSKSDPKNPRPRPSSKKADMETGEDMKGA